MILSGSASPSILIVDDEPSIQRVLERIFRQEGYSVTVVENGEDALEVVHTKRIDLVILDLHLPTISGQQICQRLRADPSCAMVGVLIITAGTTEGLAASCLEGGADDYVSKPFDLKELVARAQAILRRPRIYTSVDSVIKSGGITIHMGGRRVRVQNRLIQLTPKEFEILRLLVIHAPNVLNKNTLALKVWGTSLENLHPRTLDVHIRRIRQELGPLAKCLATVRSAGFQWFDDSILNPLPSSPSASA